MKDGAISRIPWPLLVRLMRDTTAGLSFLHMRAPDRKIIVHNDIKPDNIMVTDQLRAKVLLLCKYPNDNVICQRGCHGVHLDGYYL